LIKLLKVVDKTINIVIASKGALADTFLSRMTGLLNRKILHPDEALIITHCNSIHMFFMKFAIDAIFVSKDNIVVGLVEKIKPFRLSPIFFKASYVIEVPAGTISEKKVSIGDQISIENEE